MLTFPDFVARAHRIFRLTDWGDPGIRIGPLEESGIFYLGEDHEYNAAMNALQPDLLDEMKERVPMPFKDVSCISLCRKPADPKVVENLRRASGQFFGQVEVGEDLVVATGEPVWILDRLVEIDASHPAAREIIREGVDVDRVKQWFVMVRIHGVSGMEPSPICWAFGFSGSQPNGTAGVLCLEMARPYGNEMVEACRYITGISHPSRYVVRVTPRLSPREERREASGKKREPGKAPHFVVVDHEVLVRMKKDPEGTHASPVPHERRGHWARLAERCRHARLLGKDKVWKRPTFVGEREWQSEKALYEVLLDFNKQPK